MREFLAVLLFFGMMAAISVGVAWWIEPLVTPVLYGVVDRIDHVIGYQP